jgi:hypothetical protein
VFGAESDAGVSEEVGSIAGAVFGQDALDAHPAPTKPGRGAFQETRRGLLALVGQDLDGGEPRVVVDADMDEVPANSPTAAVSGAPAGHAMAGTAESAQLLDVEMEQLARPLLLVAPHDRRRCQGPQ